LRGKFVREVLLCQGVPAPPDGVDITLPDATEAQTARERLAVHSADPTCAGCHQLMDPIGLALENFDAIGRYRATDNGIMIDASGELDGVAFNDAAGLAQALAQHPNLPGCFVRTLFRHVSGDLEHASNQGLISDLNASFSTSGYQFRSLLTNLVSHPAFRHVGAMN
jgi:hypothetical protein